MENSDFRQYFKTFTYAQIAVGTFLGTPVAGSILSAMNAAANGRLIAGCLFVLLFNAFFIFTTSFILMPGITGDIVFCLSAIASLAFKYIVEIKEVSGTNPGGWLFTIALSITCLLAALYLFIR